MSTNAPIDPDTGQPVEPSTEDGSARPTEGSPKDDPDVIPDVGPAMGNQDLILDEVLVDDDPAMESDQG
ncbi:hypothetical protein ACFC1I_13765 [Microbacterium sp. NPDC056044]|uniref:hypothetical protein n=1 Tax=Microbacterium sp. NPDC056044 TaxID=3345690 RepID=UPI0035D76F46